MSNEEQINVFARNLRYLRLKKGLSQKKLSMLTGIPLPILRMMERGALLPEGNDPRISDLCRLFDVTLEELLYQNRN